MNADIQQVTEAECADLVCGLIQRILGNDADVAPEARLEADLQLESLDLMRLADELRQRYGPRVDLCAHVASVEFDDLLNLTVGDVIAYLVRQVGA